MSQSLDLDAALSNADWTKRSWDLPTTLDGLLYALGASASSESKQKAELAHFLQLPAAKAIPQDLRRSITAKFGL